MKLTAQEASLCLKEEKKIAVTLPYTKDYYKSPNMGLRVVADVVPLFGVSSIKILKFCGGSFLIQTSELEKSSENMKGMQITCCLRNFKLISCMSSVHTSVKLSLRQFLFTNIANQLVDVVH